MKPRLTQTTISYTTKLQKHINSTVREQNFRNKQRIKSYRKCRLVNRAKQKAFRENQ